MPNRKPVHPHDIVILLKIICLLSHDLFREAKVPHHRFRFSDLEHGKELGVPVEVHTVELLKYNLLEATISQANKIEQWAFFLLNADQYDSEELRALLPGVEFDQAITEHHRRHVHDTVKIR